MKTTSLSFIAALLFSFIPLVASATTVCYSITVIPNDFTDLNGGSRQIIAMTFQPTITCNVGVVTLHNLWKEGSPGGTPVVQIYNNSSAAPSTQIGTNATLTVNSTSQYGADATANFTSQNITLTSGTSYWVAYTSTNQSGYVSNATSYAWGQNDSDPVSNCFYNGSAWGSAGCEQTGFEVDAAVTSSVVPPPYYQAFWW